MIPPEALTMRNRLDYAALAIRNDFDNAVLRMHKATGIPPSAIRLSTAVITSLALGAISYTIAPNRQVHPGLFSATTIGGAGLLITGFKIYTDRLITHAIAQYRQTSEQLRHTNKQLRYQIEQLRHTIEQSQNTL